MLKGTGKTLCYHTFRKFTGEKKSRQAPLWIIPQSVSHIEGRQLYWIAW